MRNPTRTLLAVTIAVLGTAPVVVGVLMLRSGPDRDGVGGLDWAPVAFPLIACGGLVLTFAWLVFRDRRPEAAAPPRRRQTLLAVLLMGLGLAVLGLAADIAAHASDADTPWWLVLGSIAAVVMLGGLLVAVAWRNLAVALRRHVEDR